MNKAGGYTLPSFRDAADIVCKLALCFALLLSVDVLAQAGGTVTVSISGTGDGRISSVDGGIDCPGDCSQIYFEDVDVVLNADPAAGTVFVGWEGGGCAGTGACIVNAGQSPFVTAVFDLDTGDTPKILSVSLSGNGSGTVTSSDQAINCGSTCSASYANGESVTLTATPDTGSVFQGWQGGGCSGTGSCTVSVTQSRFVSATFATDQVVPQRILAVSVAGSGAGTVASNDQAISCPTICSASYSNGESITLTATPASGSQFQGWQGGGCSGTGSCTVAMTDSQNVTATFASQAEGVNLTISVDGAGTGSVTSNDQAINCPADCTAGYSNGETVTLSASASAGSVFQGWQGGGCSGTGTCVVTMSQSRTVTALFELAVDPERVLSVTLQGEGSGSVVSNDQVIDCPVDCTAGYSNGETVTLSASASAGSVFQGWQGGGCSGSDTCVVTMSESRNVTATFAVVPGPDRTLTVSLQGDGSGAVVSSDQAVNCPDACSSTYADGTSVTLTASPAQGSVFSGWQGSVCSGTEDCVLTLSQDTSVAALFELDGDGDGVTDATPDLCPNTPAGTAVDAQGCGPNEGPDDDDKDGVPNVLDQCPNTPPGETVNSVGCSVSQPTPADDDNDGVTNTIDQCPNTPAGQQVDAVGCGQGQQPQDDDDDGVPNTIDQCMSTAPGQTVNEAGCGANESPDDNDGDGVANLLDTCANTPRGEQADVLGCSASQADSDGDGVADVVDSCPATPAYVAAVDSEGCPAVVSFGNQLGQLAGLGLNERVLGSRLDEICPMLVKLEDQRNLTAGESDLRTACLRLKDIDTTESQAAFALREISLSELASLQNYAVDIATSQYRQVGARVGQLRAGGGGGVSVTGLDIGIDGQSVPQHLLQSAVDGILGGGASGDSFADFGKLGLFLQGDFDFGDRDETALESGYDFDSWTVSLGADYRFTDNTFGGISFSAGEVEVDYARNGGQADISSWTASLYGGWTINENFYLDGILSISQADIESRRNIQYTDAGGEFNSSHDGDTESDQLFVGLNTGYLLNRGQWRFGPTAAFSYLDGTIDGFTESSVGDSSQAWNFSVDEQDFESLRFSVGAQADYIISTSFGVLIPGIRMDYVFEQEDQSDDLGMRFVNNPFSNEELVSDRVFVRTDGKDSGFLDTSFTLSGQFIMGFSGFVSYQFYSSYEDYSRDGVSLGLRWDKPF